MRKILDEAKISNGAQDAIARFHASIVSEVEQAIQSNEWVVVGMAYNPPVKKARTLLAEKNVSFKYLEYGGYLSQWKRRLAIKLWTGWPTFPQIFHNGVLVGGHKDLVAYLNKSS